MEFKTTPNVEATADTESSNLGLDDVTRSARALLKTTTNLGTSSLEVLERELAMAISISEQIRDGLITSPALERNRKQELTSQLRNDAVHAVDLAIDAGGLIYYSALDFIGKYADTRRKTLPVDSATGKTY